jgi:hypothetical protein
MKRVTLVTIDKGILAIWNRCAAGKEQEYEAWYQSEHLPERVSISGFRCGRRYQAIEPAGGYFTYYETNEPDVLTSDAYRYRVNNPTPMTTRIMQGAFTDMSRTVCRRAFQLGRMRGAFAATLQIDGLPPEEWLRDWAASEARIASIARIEGWEAVDEGLPASTEARLRGGDERIKACLFVETLREADCVLAQEDLSRSLHLSAAKAGVYRLLCELTSCERGLGPEG